MVLRGWWVEGLSPVIPCHIFELTPNSYVTGDRPRVTKCRKKVVYAYEAI